MQCDCIFCTLPSWSGHICFGAYSSLGALPDGPWQMPTIAVALGWRAVPPPDLKKKKKKVIPKFPNITVFPFGLPCFYSWFTSHYILSFTVCCPYFYLNSSVCLTSHLGFHISSPLTAPFFVLNLIPCPLLLFHRIPECIRNMSMRFLYPLLSLMIMYIPKTFLTFHADVAINDLINLCNKVILMLYTLGCIIWLSCNILLYIYISSKFFVRSIYSNVAPKAVNG